MTERLVQKGFDDWVFSISLGWLLLLLNVCICICIWIKMLLLLLIWLLLLLLLLLLVLLLLSILFSPQPFLLLEELAHAHAGNDRSWSSSWSVGPGISGDEQAGVADSAG